MTRDEAQKLWPIIKAYGEGKTVQYQTGSWEDLRDNVEFDRRPVSLYRIKPEPVECWAVVSRDGYLICTSESEGEAEQARRNCSGASDYRVIRMVEA